MMAKKDYRPVDLARRLARRRDDATPSKAGLGLLDRWRRETFTLPRAEARREKDCQSVCACPC